MTQSTIFRAPRAQSRRDAGAPRRFIVMGLLCIAAPVFAAPLDGLLTALPETYSDKLTVEVGYDMANDTVDVFNFRGDVSQDVGDYAGGHVRVIWPVTRFLQIDGSLWKRGIDYHEDTIKLDSWQIGAQHRIANQQGALPALALRLSAWGSRSDSVTKSVATLNGFTATAVSVHKPEDRQYQADLIASWRLGDNWQLDGFAGMGRGKVQVGHISVATIEGKNTAETIKLEGNSGGVINKLESYLPEATVSSGGITATAKEIRVSKDLVKIGSLEWTEGANDFSYKDVRIEPNLTNITLPTGMSSQELVALSTRALFDFSQVEYNFNYAQAGFALSWHQNDWRLRGSYLFQTFDRDSGVSNAYTTVQTLSGEVGYRLGKGVAAFLRGQVMDHNLMGETPLAYNTLTASRFDKRYGLLTLGLVVGF